MLYLLSRLTVRVLRRCGIRPSRRSQEFQLPLEEVADKTFEVCPAVKLLAITHYDWRNHEQRITESHIPRVVKKSRKAVIRDWLNRLAFQLPAVRLHCDPQCNTFQCPASLLGIGIGVLVEMWEISFFI